MIRIEKKLLELKDHADAPAFSIILGQIKNNNCEFCTGEGHKASECPTKNDLDAHFKKAGFGVAWGKIKSKVLQDNIKKRKTALVKRVATDREKIVEENKGRDEFKRLVKRIKKK